MVDSLVVKNLAWIYAIARTFCRNRYDAEDLAGETILKVLVNKGRYDSNQSFRLWVLVIMRNTFCVHIRHRGIVASSDKVPEVINYIDPCRCSIIDDEMSIVERSIRDSVSAQCAYMYAKGYSYKEIADAQGVNVNIVKSRIHQGRKMLIKRLNR